MSNTTYHGICEIVDILTEFDVFQAQGYVFLPDVPMEIAPIDQGVQIVRSIEEAQLEKLCDDTGIRAVEMPEEVANHKGFYMVYGGDQTYAFVSNAKVKGQAQAEIHFPNRGLLADYLQTVDPEHLPDRFSLSFTRGIVDYDIRGNPKSWHRFMFNREKGTSAPTYSTFQLESMREQYLKTVERFVDIDEVIEDVVLAESTNINTRVHVPRRPNCLTFENFVESYGIIPGFNTKMNVDMSKIKLDTGPVDYTNPDDIFIQKEPEESGLAAHLRMNSPKPFLKLMHALRAEKQNPPQKISARFMRNPRLVNRPELYMDSGTAGIPVSIIGVPEEFDSQGYVTRWMYRADYQQDLVA